MDYRESDRIVTLLTPGLGVISAIARGARSSRRRFAGALSPFCLLDVLLVASRNELYRLEQARVAQPCMGLLSELPRMTAAGALMEMVRRIGAVHDPDPGLYQVSASALLQLDSCPREQLSAHRVAAAARVLVLSGWAPDLEKCGLCQRAPAPTQAAELDPAAGHLVCRACGGGPIMLSGRVRSAFAALLGDRGEAAAEMGEETARAIDRALSAIIRCHVE